MINKDSIVTAYDEHLTLVEWLQKVENALNSAVLTNLGIAKLSDKDNVATYQVTATFADNSTIASDSFTLPSPDIVAAFNNLATLVNGFDSRIATNRENVNSILDVIDIASEKINADALKRSINGDDDVIVEVDHDEDNEKLGIHLSPELQAKLARVLLKPSSAPSSRKVVTIDTNGAQDNVDPTELPTLMSNIVDSDGHKRFVVLPKDNTISPELRINPNWVKFEKSVLNGRSLRIVVIIDIPSGETLDDDILCNVTLLKGDNAWINDKIVATISYYGFKVIENKVLFDVHGKPYSVNFWLAKLSVSDGYYIRTLGSYTNNTKDDVVMRVEFNLIID